MDHRPVVQLLSLWGILALGCGSSRSSEPQDPSDVAATQEREPSTVDEPSLEGEQGADEAESPPGDAPALEPWDIVYRVTPDGPVIAVAGVDFRPRAEAVRKGKGWGTSLTVSATVRGSELYRMLSPEDGPLMMAARVEGSGEPKLFPDERSGDEEVFLTPGEPETFSRSFPPDDGAALEKGETVTLIVGLWGLGVDAGQRRPVRRLFQVRMTVGAGQPQPVISPPEGMR
jgi:hypothetical protein